MKRPHKFNARKTVLDGLTFDSSKEARRWSELLLLQRAGKITGLERQVVYVLAPAVKLHGEARIKPALRYIADFRYYVPETGETIVEDVKSPATAEEKAFRIKLHLMMSVHGIGVRLT